jgi:predicted N-acetyltransferase YhbS
MEIQLRKATKGDMAGIHTLVHELAVYEKAPEAHITTVEEYQKDFENGRFDSIVAVENGEVMGMVLFYQGYSTWKGKMLFLDDFVVKESLRGKGIGRLLFEAFLEEAKRLECKMVKWQVLDWNTPAIHFYEKYPVTFDGEWIDVKMFF